MAQPDYTDGSMLALYPPASLARALAVDGGLDPAGMHLTIAYTGDAAGVDQQALADAAAAVAAKAGPVTATISGHARFTGGDDDDVIVALVDSPQLDQLRAAAVAELAARGIEAHANHGFTAHMSIAYLDAGDDDPVGRIEARPVTFTALTAKHGGDATAYPFGDIADLAREAYAAGWALSGGPWTPRVAAGCVAAVEAARACSGDEHVLEATLNIGKLQGVWALFFSRRAELTARYVADVLAAWRAIAEGLDPAPVIARLLAEIGPVAPGIEAAQVAYLNTLTASAAASLLAGAYADTAGHNVLQATVEDGLRAATAEGKAGTLALNAEQHGLSDRFSFDAAYQAIYDQLAHLPDLPLAAQEWVQRILAGASRDIGLTIARLAREGESAAVIAKAVDAELSGAGGAVDRAITLFVNQAMSQAMSQAALDLYQSEGATDVYFVTAGDDRVCFPAGTPVATPDGERPIESLKPGDLVVTPQGQRAISGVMERPYAGGMTVVYAAARSVVATDDHPFMTSAGWRKAGQLRPGDLLKTLGDELAEVERVVHLNLTEPDDAPSCALHGGVPPAVPCGAGLVPVGAVGLQRYAEVGEREVDGPAADRVLLREAEPEPGQDLAHAGLQGGLAAEPAVAGHVAEPPPLGDRGLGTELAAAGQADDPDGRPATLLGAVPPVEALLGAEPRPASPAVDVLGPGGPAGPRAHGVAAGDGAFGDREALAADRAELRDRVSAAGLIAAAGAEDALRVLTSRPTGIEGDAAALAGTQHQTSIREMTLTCAILPTVYDITVPVEHVFYAAGLLVHNCPQCDLAEANSPYSLPNAPVPGLHPSCRCVLTVEDPAPFKALAAFLA